MFIVQRDRFLNALRKTFLGHDTGEIKKNNNNNKSQNKSQRSREIIHFYKFAKISELRA